MPFQRASLAPRRLQVIALGLSAVLSVVGPDVSPASGQVLDDRLVPNGLVRVSAWPSFTAWDERFGASGEADRVPLGADLSRQSVLNLFPGGDVLATSLGGLVAMPEYLPGAAPVRGNVSQDVTRIDFGIDVGVTDWWTVGVSVPRLRNRAEIDVAFRPDTVAGDLGISPYVTRRSAVGSFLGELETAAGAAAARASSLCSAEDPGCGPAQELADQAERFRNRLATAYQASPLFPLAASSFGASLEHAVADFDAQLAAAGLPGLTEALPLATARPTESDLSALPVLFEPLGFREPLETRPGRWLWGDVELSTTVRLLEVSHRDPDPDAPRLRVLGSLLLRLGTGDTADPDVPFALGAGDGQTDVEARVSGLGTLGTGLSLRMGAVWGTQGARTVTRRAASASEPLPSARTRATLSWDPSSYWGLEAEPALRLAGALSLGAVYRYFDKGADAFRLAADGAPTSEDFDLTVLANESALSRHELGVLLTYETVERSRIASVRPLRIYTRFLTAVSGAGARIPATTRVEFGLSVFARLWG